MCATGQFRIRDHIGYTSILKTPFCVVSNLTQLWAIVIPFLLLSSYASQVTDYICFFMSHEILLIQLCSRSCKPADLIENIPFFFVDHLFDGSVNQKTSFKSHIINRSSFILVKEREQKSGLLCKIIHNMQMYPKKQRDRLSSRISQSTGPLCIHFLPTQQIHKCFCIFPSKVLQKQLSNSATQFLSRFVVDSSVDLPTGCFHFFFFLCFCTTAAVVFLTQGSIWTLTKG